MENMGGAFVPSCETVAPARQAREGRGIIRQPFPTSLSKPDGGLPSLLSLLPAGTMELSSKC